MIATQGSEQLVAIAGDPVIERIARLLMPVDAPPPDEWAEDQRMVSPDSSPSHGKWSNNYVPWIAPALCVLDDEPTKKGIIVKKYAQACFSDIFVTLFGYWHVYAPGPKMFITSTIAQAKKFGTERFDYMIRNSPDLSRVFRMRKRDGKTKHLFPCDGGPLMLGGAGSANQFISNPARHAGIDEYDEVGEIPDHGDPFSTLEMRLNEYGTRVRTALLAWAHPSRPDRGIAKLYDDLSDRRSWQIRCPHCDHQFKPAWNHVVIDTFRGSIVRDPSSATYYCPSCEEAIDDAQRWAASMAGEFVTELEPEVAARRRYVGLSVSRLCHPRVPLVDMAQSFCDAVTEPQVRVIVNKQMGEPYTSASTVVTREMIEEKCLAGLRPDIVPEDTLFITAGFDVQSPKHSPTFYWCIVAWTRSGAAILLEYQRAQGFAAVQHRLTTFNARRGDAAGELLRISGAGMDYGYMTQEVYAFCAERHGGVPVLPMKHEPRVTEAQRTRRRDVEDKLRPAGSIVTLQLCRHYWMDRSLGRFAQRLDAGHGGGVALPPTVDHTFMQHILSNKRFETVDEHGHPQVEWIKPDGSADDFAQAFLMAEVIAVGLGLDELHKFGEPGETQSAQSTLTGGLEDGDSKPQQPKKRKRDTKYRSRSRERW